MSESTAVYLKDHMAGAIHASELLRTLRDRQHDAAISDFAARLLHDIEEDRHMLAEIAGRFGVDPDGISVKEVAGWMSEKLARFKLKHDSQNEFGLFEALEFLVLGVAGKHALWRVLSLLSSSDSRLDGFDFNRLMDRAAKQHSELEECRLRVGFRALNGA